MEKSSCGFIFLKAEMTFKILKKLYLKEKQFKSPQYVLRIYGELVRKMFKSVYVSLFLDLPPTSTSLATTELLMITVFCYI